MHAALVIFVFVIGACVGSFLNVLVWRVPRLGWGALVSPPSHCPRCKHPLAWCDNIPVLGWFFLRGRCRYCREPISIRYPIVEFTCGALFAFYYAMFFMLHLRGMTSIAEQWPMYVLLMAMIASLLAISLIDGELYLIPPEIPWFLAIAGVIVHAVIDHRQPLAVNVGSMAGGMAVGGAAGLLVSVLLFQTGRLKRSFPDGEPVPELDEQMWKAELEFARREGLPEPQEPRVYSIREIRAELLKEMQFLMLPMLGALLAAVLLLCVPRLDAWWAGLMRHDWLSGMLGAVFGALIGGFLIWVTRILGTLTFGKVAMGLGDVHLMFGVGAIVGAGPAAITFFLAPFAGALVGLWNAITRSRRELPYGPYLSLAAAAVLLIYPPIANYLRPGLEALSQMLRGAGSGA